MDPSPTTPSYRWRRRLAFGALVMAGLVALVTVTAPVVLSSRAVRERLEQALGDALGRAVRVAAVEVSWAGRLRLEGLQVEDRPGFAAGPLLRLDDLRVEFEPLALIRGRLEAGVTVDGLDLRLVRNPDGTINVADLIPPAKQPAPREPEGQTPPTLPFSGVDLEVRIDRVTIAMDDRAGGRSGRVTEGFLHLDTQSPDHTVQISAGATLGSDGQPPAPVRLEATLSRWVADDGALTPAAATARIRVTLPGAELTLEGEAGGESGTARFAGSARITPGALLEAVAPFLPPDIAPTKVRGALTVAVDADGPPGGVIEFRVRLDGRNLALTGPTVAGGQPVGPLDLSLEQVGRYDGPSRALTLDRGVATVQTGTRLAWSGTVRGLGDDVPEVEVALGPVQLDLRELHRLAAPFLAGTPAPITWGPGPSPWLRLAHATATGPVGAGPDDPGLTVTLEGLTLEVPDVEVSLDSGSARARGVHVRAGSLGTTLHGGVPRTLSLDAEATVDRVDLGGESPVALRSLEIPRFHLRGRDLTAKPESPGGPFTGALELAQSLTLGSSVLGDVARVDGLAQNLDATLRLGPDGAMGLRVEELRLSISDASYVVDPVRMDMTQTTLAVAGFTLEGALPEAPETLTLEALDLDLEDLALSEGARAVTADTLTVGLRAVSLALEDLFPRDVSLVVTGHGSGLAVDGPIPVALGRLELLRLGLVARGLHPSPAALFGVVGRVELEQELLARELTVPDRLAAPELSQRLRLTGRLTPGAQAVFQVPELSLVAQPARLDGIAGPGEPPLRIGANLTTAVKFVRLDGTGPEAISIEGLRVRGTVGDLARLEAHGAAEGSGRRSLTSTGTLRFDLGALADLPPSLRAGGRFAGTADLNWNLTGRLPSGGEWAQLRNDPVSALTRDEPTPFLDTLELDLTLVDVAAELPGETVAPRVAVGGISTTPILGLRVADRGTRVDLVADLVARWVEALPGLPLETEPLDLSLAVRGTLREADEVHLDESLRVAPLGLEQQFSAALGGFRRLTQLDPPGPSALWLNVLGGKATGSVRVRDTSAPGPLPGGLDLAGTLGLELAAELVRGESLTARVRFTGTDASLAVDDRVRIEGLDAELALSKTLRLTADPGSAAGGAHPGWLSEEVLRPESAAGPGATATGAGREGGGLRVRRVRMAAEPVPIEFRNLSLRVGFPDSLPALDHFQADLLGGTVVTRAALTRGADGYRARGEVTFTGLDANRLVPGTTTTGPPGEAGETEVSGQLGFGVPVGGSLTDLLESLELRAGLTHVGPRTLDRALYSLDPAESNPAILEQRRLVRLGSPRWVEARARHGNLRLDGEVVLAGTTVALPPLERFPLGRLPRLLGLDPTAEPGAEWVRVLDMVSADRLVIRPDGGFRLVRSSGGESP